MTEPGNLRRRADDRDPRGGGTVPTETEGNASDRRQADRRAGERRAGGDRRGRLMQRWRQPIVGLGLAGLAIPMAKATSPEATPETEPATEDQDLASVASGEDTEEALAEQIAESREDEARSQQVEQAVDRYGIDRDLAEDIYDAAREASIEPRLAYGLIKTESTFNERAVSPVGARGLTQVMPRTAAWLVPGTRTQDLYDRETNLRLGFTYLNQMIDKYKGDVRLALLAYNRGPGTVDKVLKRGGNPDNGYADKVLRG
ncbi:MAG TPA: lytic transglycosylase domain-containing protein [Longimicrobiales bacterium]|nr:lytic transglycosylase domain-containing protein [Longimicrobiales bacterium]